MASTVYETEICFGAGTPYESAVAPKSLRSRTLLSLVRHMSGAAFGSGLINRSSCLVKFCWFGIIAQAGKIELMQLSRRELNPSVW